MLCRKSFTAKGEGGGSIAALVMVTIDTEVVRAYGQSLAHRDGESIKEIAPATGTSKNTVKKYLRFNARPRQAGLSNRGPLMANLQTQIALRKLRTNIVGDRMPPSRFRLSCTSQPSGYVASRVRQSKRSRISDAVSPVK